MSAENMNRFVILNSRLFVIFYSRSLKSLCSSWNGQMASLF